MDSQKKSDKICVSKSVSIIALGILFLVGVVLYSSFLGKTKTANKTRAEGSQCIYLNLSECKDNGCDGLCTKVGCTNETYQCNNTINSNPTLAKLTPTSSPIPVISTSNNEYLCGKSVCESPKKYCVIKDALPGDYDVVCSLKPSIFITYSRPVDSVIFRYSNVDKTKPNNEDAVMVTFSDNLKTNLNLAIKGCAFYPISNDLITSSNPKLYFEKYHNIDTYQAVDFSLDTFLRAEGSLAVGGLDWIEDRDDKEGRKPKLLVKTTTVACSKKLSKSAISFRYTIALSPTTKETKEIQTTIK